jgi:hypothetical protein
MKIPIYSSAIHILRDSSAFTLTFFLLLILSTTSFAQDENGENTPSQTSVIAQELGKLKFTELCKTPEGRQFILDNYDPIMLRDLKFQWEGSKANNQTTTNTIEEYITTKIKRDCEHPAVYTWSFPPPPKPIGRCDNPSFGAPYYDVEATVQKALALDEYYRSSSDPQAGSTPEERIKRRNNAIVMLLKVQESDLYHAYQTIGCIIRDTAECTAGTGQKKICDKTLVYAPVDQEFIRGSLKGLRHVKEGPGLDSPTVAWYKVGATGHRTNFGTMQATTLFTLKGATRRAVTDVDVIRREFIARGFPVDKTPEPIAPRTEPVPQPRTEPRPVPAPANLIIKATPRSTDQTYFDVIITNTGGSPITVNYQIIYLDGFFTIHQWKIVKTVNVIIHPGQTHTDWWHERDALGWRFQRF